MSFEGFYQVICAAGHYHEESLWDFDSRVYSCGDLVDGKQCDAPAKWSNLVDETNCEREGYVEVCRVTQRVTKRCDMGHDHVVTHETYVHLSKGPLGALAELANDEEE